MVAYVVSGGRGAITQPQARSFLKQKLPDYMAPAIYVFLDSLTLTSNGKLDRRALPPPEQRNASRPEPVVVPRDALQLQIVNIWVEVLRVGSIGFNENSFELGGDSLLAIRMLARIQKVLHKRISLATPMLAPTVEKFAQTIRDPSLTRPQIFGIQPNGFRPVVLLRGSRSILANRLGTDQPFFGLPMPEPSLLPTPYRLEDIAAACIQTLLEVQPKGPYFLGGWCDAGVIAYEMVQQLTRRGETVALVILFDTQNQAHRPDVSSSIESARIRLCFLTQWLQLQWRTVLGLKPRELAGHLRNGLSFRLTRLRVLPTVLICAPVGGAIMGCTTWSTSRSSP